MNEHYYDPPETKCDTCPDVYDCIRAWCCDDDKRDALKELQDDERGGVECSISKP